MMTLKEQHELIKLIQRELMPNRLPAEFIEHVALGSWMFNVPYTTQPSDWMRVQIHKMDEKRLTFVFDLNGREMARLDFYAAGI